MIIVEIQANVVEKLDSIKTLVTRNHHSLTGLAQGQEELKCGQEEIKRGVRVFIHFDYAEECPHRVFASIRMRTRRSRFFVTVTTKFGCAL